MAIHSVKLTADGRIQLPAQLRREMGLNIGDTLNLELQDGCLSVRKPSKTLERIRSRLAPYLDPGTPLVDDLVSLDAEGAAHG
ncbi:AbrB/MazE/SpoVT family DNA-binding domain-containing protein [Sphingomonas sp. SKA58]|uniref:AbrB/MazE/SpoVT family DNA-binding domain-containing protein n=1 Tax=Sphingomonas sp. (strain SKA58) TaxID=314266 RepID=UPI0005696876|nr:AbrB/MazE/SpoVT family DNA-binding domain-containing protein [Sphingomonas sp. SKA58]